MYQTARMMTCLRAISVLPIWTEGPYPVSPKAYGRGKRRTARQAVLRSGRLFEENCRYIFSHLFRKPLFSGFFIFPARKERDGTVKPYRFKYGMRPYRPMQSEGCRLRPGSSFPELPASKLRGWRQGPGGSSSPALRLGLGLPLGVGLYRDVTPAPVSDPSGSETGRRLLCRRVTAAGSRLHQA